MRIVLFAMSMNKGGAEHVISTLCNYGIEKNHDMHIVTCLQGDSAYELDEKVTKHEGFISMDEYRSKNKALTLPRFCRMYIDQMRRIDPDVIVSFLPEPCMITELCKKKVGKPIIGAERSNPYFQYRSFVYRILVELLLRQKTNLHQKLYKADIRIKNHRFYPQSNSKSKQKNIFSILCFVQQLVIELSGVLNSYIKCSNGDKGENG